MTKEKRYTHITELMQEVVKKDGYYLVTLNDYDHDFYSDTAIMKVVSIDNGSWKLEGSLQKNKGGLTPIFRKAIEHITPIEELLEGLKE